MPHDSDPDEDVHASARRLQDVGPELVRRAAEALRVDPDADLIGMIAEAGTLEAKRCRTELEQGTGVEFAAQGFAGVLTADELATILDRRFPRETFAWLSAGARGYELRCVLCMTHGFRVKAFPIEHIHHEERETSPMNGMEERVQKLEKQLRIFRVVALFAAAGVLSFLGMLAYSYWSYRDYKPPAFEFIGSAPIATESGPAGHSLFTTTQQGVPYVSLVARDKGWALQMHNDRGVLLGDHGEMSLAFRPSETDSRPSLVLTDKAGKEVWHVP